MGKFLMNARNSLHSTVPLRSVSIVTNSFCIFSRLCPGRKCLIASVNCASVNFFSGYLLPQKKMKMIYTAFLSLLCACVGICEHMRASLRACVRACACMDVHQCTRQAHAHSQLFFLTDYCVQRPIEYRLHLGHIAQRRSLTQWLWRARWLRSAERVVRRVGHVVDELLPLDRTCSTVESGLMT